MGRPAPAGSPTPTPIPVRPFSPDPIVTPAAYINTCIENIKLSGDMSDTWELKDIVAHLEEMRDACQAAEQ